MSDKNLLSQQRTNLAIKRTKLANQRTLLAYMRTGFAIAAIAGTFKKMYLVYFGILMIVISGIQYYIVLRGVETGTFDYEYLDYLPLIFVFTSLLTLYLQFTRK